MRSLIKLFFSFLVLILIIFWIWPGPIIGRIGSRLLNAEIVISNTKFIPYKLIFELNEIKIPQRNVLFNKGSISLIPFNIKFYGINYEDLILLGEDDFSVNIAGYGKFKLNARFKNLNLNKIFSAFKGGNVRGAVNGVYSKNKIEMDGLVSIDKIIYSGEENVLGMSSDELTNILDSNKGHMELDFTYNGPIDGVEEIFNYRPGPKTMRIIKTYLFQKILK